MVSAVGVNSQAGIIFTLLGAAVDEQEKQAKKSKKGGDEEQGITENSHMAPAANKVKSEAGEAEATSPTEEVAGGGGKEQSVLQAKLTKLAIQIGYGGSLIAIITVIILIVRFSIHKYYIEDEPW